MKFFKKKLKGSIIEQLVALLIILLILSFAFIIIGNSVRSNNVIMKTRAVFLCSNILEETIELKDTSAIYEMQEDGIKIEQNVHKYNSVTGLKLIEIKALDIKDDILYQRKLIVDYDK